MSDSNRNPRWRTVVLIGGAVAVLALIVFGRVGLALFLSLPLLVLWAAPKVGAIDEANRDAGMSSEDGPAVAPDTTGIFGGF